MPLITEIIIGIGKSYKLTRLKKWYLNKRNRSIKICSSKLSRLKLFSLIRYGFFKEINR